MQPLGPLSARRPTHIYTRANTHTATTRQSEKRTPARARPAPIVTHAYICCVCVLCENENYFPRSRFASRSGAVPLTTHALMTKTTTNACRDKLKF